MAGRAIFQLTLCITTFSRSMMSIQSSFHKNESEAYEITIVCLLVCVPQ
jgi:hypothetical protein